MQLSPMLSFLYRHQNLEITFYSKANIVKQDFLQTILYYYPRDELAHKVQLKANNIQTHELSHY